ncbi:ABC transporter ATP-binding protein [Ketogulonicigenium vulgare]|uniref:ABC-type polysaccharide/polyol phosphate transport system ATPase component-like protein n=1 Tax=Ketogulonicigenium vulgare (strain WSH-001) TaxID=759362 RepID=F9Y817_KETVW|nr:ATP-binding cassette domain-containing protein [Ketogulonicigenium vulgare]ADO42956.1 ABC transporter related protein [Ketogulonicigenium vulgare Y25]AEM41143.1 ABC-type polysaccharide/polyol phosphate transport system ATPase component-like protein [Ketogulonicigenium vulgare WSH-001]ALJ81281.1 hypothetical protein KVH_08865 [Ketogulonicigenium vulgare]ANW34020.1 hypothetical protein KvSKV_08835 [Ketogulonicigenium vulgare]AOZ54865.1 ABC transporter [Ketogulonicigenium vulgare]
MIAFQKVSRWYGPPQDTAFILQNTDAVFETGQHYVIMATAGSGKSALLRLISGADQPNSGRVQRDEAVSWPLAMATIFTPRLTARQNLGFIARLHGLATDHLVGKIEEFATLGRALDRPVGSFTTTQRLALAFGASFAVPFHTHLIDETYMTRNRVLGPKVQNGLENLFASRRVIAASPDAKFARRYFQRGFLLHQRGLHLYTNIDALIAAFEAARLT